jgi:ABC-type transport system involved in multi-copper enzyme maturation permease subunit
MIFLPVVERELRVAARRRVTYWGRFASGLIGAALAAWVLLAMEDANEKAAGAQLFIVVSVVVFLYATVAGTLVTCDCLSEEKREGTLGLLFLTDLKGHDVVLGKLAATSVNAFYGMLALLPMLAIPFIVGGVTQAEMLRVVLVSINLLFFFLSIGLFVSALCRKDNWALGLSILLGLVFVWGGPVAMLIKGFPNSSEDWALLSSPAFGCFLAFDDLYNSTTLTDPHFLFWLNAAFTHLYSWIFFGMACWIVPRSWQDSAFGKKASWRAATTDVRRRRTRRALLEVNPFLWRVARAGHKWLLPLTLGLWFVLWLWFTHLFSDDRWDPGMDLFLLLPAGFILKAWLAAEASRTLSEDRRSGGLELLLSTPLHERDIVRGQLSALWRQFAWPAASVLLAYLVFTIVEMRRWTSDERAEWLGIHLLFGGFLAADLIALSWDGMWLGLINRKPNRAALLVLTRILVLPGVLFVLLKALWALTPKATESAESAAFTLWLMLGLAADLYFGLRSRAKLQAQFRTIVAEGVTRNRTAQAVPKPAPALAEVS